MVMKKTYLKSILREIKKSCGRFIAIVGIVALGVGFLVGILSANPDMRAAVDRYYRQNNMCDAVVKSTAGLVQRDLDALAALDGVETVMPAYSLDTLLESDAGGTLAARVYGLPLAQNGQDSFLNHLTLLSGRMPEKAGECVIQNPIGALKELSAGEKLRLSEKQGAADKTSFSVDGFTVVGVVENPYYFSTEREPTTVGSGKLDAIVYADADCFALDVYTDAFLTFADAKAHEAFTDAYEDAAADGIGRVEALADTQTALRYDELKKTAEAELEKGRQELEENREKAERELAQAKQTLDDSEAELAEGEAALEAGQAQYEAGKQALTEAEQALLASGMTQQEAAAALAQREAELSAAKEELDRTAGELDRARRTLEEGRAEYEENRREAEEELAEAEADLAAAQKDVDAIAQPEWYVLGRTENVSYASYQMNIRKIADVAKVFPVFFFLVSVLVTLTTMTRMVEDERTQIGTLKALGFRKSAITLKYIAYCGLATLLGCGLGLACGFFFLPAAVYSVYAFTYHLPPLVIGLSPVFALVSCGAQIACTLGATWAACRLSMKERPASLMLPRAPRAGKRIALERIGPLWRRMPFSYKATARNIFRNKKHLLMTVIGVAGCTALLLAGFGIRDSISMIVDRQFDTIFQYDMKLDLSGGDTGDETLAAFLDGKAYTALHSESVTLSAGGESASVTLYAPGDGEEFAAFIRLCDRRSGKGLTLSDDGVLLTEKAADLLGLSPGDVFSVQNADRKTAELTLAGITENYAGSYIYVGRAAYEAAFGTAELNTLLLRAGITDAHAQDEAASRLLEGGTVSGVEFLSQTRDSYESLLTSLNLIVLVLIGAAAGLAIVVLYNITNVNITERLKELATLRVLGFHHGEVARYIFREIILLTLLGTAVGLLLGVALHRYIAVVADSAELMLGRQIFPLSYVWAALATLAFSGVVDLLMLPKLHRIRMAESMKAVD